MGAEWVIHTSSPGVSYHGIGATPIPESRHVMGTVRMGDDPDTSVVDRWGRVHSLDNVVVADSSVFVTSSGYGPTLTLVALAARAAHHLAGTTPEPRRPVETLTLDLRLRYRKEIRSLNLSSQGEGRDSVVEPQVRGAEVSGCPG